MKRVALVHDWLTTPGGAEQVLSQLTKYFPGAPVYTGFSWPSSEKLFPGTEFRHTYLQSLPKSLRKQSLLIPLLPAAFESLDLKNYDTIISLGTGYSKGVITSPGQQHFSYCHTPARYLWHLGGDMRNRGHLDFGLRARAEHNLRIWDVSSAARVDTFLANSATTQDRISKIYRRESTILYPPVNIERYGDVVPVSGGYFLSVGRLVAYKRVDLLILACQALGKRLLIAGEGPELAHLQKLVNPGGEVSFLGRPNDDTLGKLYAGADALLFAAEEDFGIVPVEAQSVGVPVVAFGRGGAVESVQAGLTGEFFYEQSVESLINLLKSFNPTRYDPKVCRKSAARFSTEVFCRRLKLEVGL